MPGRKFSQPNSSYRYGFNGKEQDKETTGTSTYDYGFRIYNPALGRFLSVDPLTVNYPMLTPYQFASNCPISGIDLDGLEFYFTADGKLIGKFGNSLAVRIVTDVKVQAKITTDFKDPNIDKTQEKLYENSISIGGSKVIGETIDVYNRTKKNGGKNEESSIVKKTNGMEILRGKTGPDPKAEFDKEGNPSLGVAPSTLPDVGPLLTIYVEDPNTTLKMSGYNKVAEYLNSPEAIIHSHPFETIVSENPILENKWGVWAYNTALSTGKDADMETLKNRNAQHFIIVGRLKANDIYKIEKRNGEPVISEKQSAVGATYYDKSGNKQLDIKIDILKDILSQITQ